MAMAVRGMPFAQCQWVHTILHPDSQHRLLHPPSSYFFTLKATELPLFETYSLEIKVDPTAKALNYYLLGFCF